MIYISANVNKKAIVGTPSLKNKVSLVAKYQFYYELQNSPKEKDMDITALYQIFLGCTDITTDSPNSPEGSQFKT